MADSLMRYLAMEKMNRNEEYLETPDCNEDMIARLLITSTLSNVNITEVKVVHNNYLSGMYELKKLEYKSRNSCATEKILIHATSASNVTSIIKNNLDWRRVTRSKYGKGVSFSDDADYANFHCNISNGSQRAFIVASVLVTNTAPGNSLMNVPPTYADTTVSDTRKVYVKYYDNEFLPKYVVYYTAPDRTTSKHYHFKRRRHPFYLF